MTNNPAWFAAPYGPPMPGMPEFLHQTVIERRRLLSSGTVTTTVLAAVTTAFGLIFGLFTLVAEQSTTEADINRIVMLALAAFCVGTSVNPVVFNTWGRRAPNETELRRRLHICLRVYLVAPLFLWTVWAVSMI